MTKSQNTKSEQLTEQWKKGKLPEGWYYVKCDDGICFDRFTYYGGFSKIFNYSVKQILAPVPSYEEWKALNESYDSTVDANLSQATWMVDMEKENAQLKELLKECKQWFDWYHIDTGTGKEYIESWHKKGHEIHKKINEALK